MPTPPMVSVRKPHISSLSTGYRVLILVDEQAKANSSSRLP
ncbi:hypothetical protein [Merismopedia glauca]|nr:hypothetical protein [Merismopedia glauca]